VDEAISDRMKALDLRHGASKPAWYALTLLGQRGTVLVLTAPLVCWFCLRIRGLEPAVRYLVAVISLVVIVTVLKSTVTRLPPAAVPGVPGPSDSFPSGHVANATLVWGLVAWCAIRAAAPVPVVRTLGALRVFAPLAVIVGMTALDYHWLSDFVAGLCIGIALLAVATAPWWTSVARALDRAAGWAQP
jgi:membrane-associated phospholipid phosphatase